MQIFCKLFNTCRKKSSLEAGIVTVSILESLPMVPNVRVLPYVEDRQNAVVSTRVCKDEILCF
jgi:hypothetical protein